MSSNDENKHEESSDESEDDSSFDEESDEQQRGEDDEESSDDEGEKLRKELADIPLGELQKIKETIGLKKYSQAVFGSWKPQSQQNLKQNTADRDEIKTTDKSKKDFKKDKVKSKKSEPDEKSSKHKIFRPRTVVTKIGKTRRDPRFDDLSGQLNDDLFQKSYSFVDDMRKEEQKSVRKQLKKVKGKERKAELSTLLQRMEHQEKAKQELETKKEQNRKRKKLEYDSVKQGKKAFYLKNSDKKKIELAEKYRKLKQSGGLERYMGKKMKKNASKEKKKLPYLKVD